MKIDGYVNIFSVKSCLEITKFPTNYIISHHSTSFGLTTIFL